MLDSLPHRVTIYEVGPRDRLQSKAAVAATRFLAEATGRRPASRYFQAGA
jgi:hypothetical protein